MSAPTTKTPSELAQEQLAASTQRMLPILDLRLSKLVAGAGPVGLASALFCLRVLRLKLLASLGDAGFTSDQVAAIDAAANATFRRGLESAKRAAPLAAAESAPSLGQRIVSLVRS